jgi:hypothetical protein
MSDENVVALSHLPDNSQALSINIDGRPTHIDIVTGDLYDKAGNSAGRWSPMDQKRHDEENKALRLAAHHQATGITAASIRGCCVSQERERVEQVASQFQMLSHATEEQRVQALDVGVADVHVPGALTNFVTGYNNEGPVGDIYSPPLVVAKKSDYYWQFDRKDAFQRALPQLGSPAGQAPELEPRFGNTKFTTIMRAVAGFVPTEVEANQDAPLNIKLATSTRMVDAAVLESEFRRQAVARTSGNWNSATTIAAGYQWNGGANSDPVKDFNNACEASHGRPNAAIVPEHIWNSMCRNPAVRGYYAYGGTSPGILTDVQMSTLLKLPEIYISRMKYINTSGTLSYVWGNDVVIFRRPAAMPPVNQRDVCTSVTFRWGLTNVKLEDGQQFSPDMIDGRGWVMRQFYNQYRGQLGGIQMVLVLSDIETQTSKYVGNLLINAYQQL